MVKSGLIQIQEEQNVLTRTNSKKAAALKISFTPVKDLFELFSKTEFYDFDKLAASILGQKGLYCIRLKANAKLPDRYNKILNKRENKIIYIGKAYRQSLQDRLSQEVYHTRPGTFFRSIGAVLGYTPIPGHLKGMSNQKNYKFSKTDTEAITKWLLKNTELAVCPIEDDFSIEDNLIKKYCPLLNDKHNPMKLAELKADRQRCREIAVGK